MPRIERRPYAPVRPVSRASLADAIGRASVPGSGRQTARRHEPQHRPGGRRTLDSGCAPRSACPRPSRPAPACRAPRTGHSCAPVPWRGPQASTGRRQWAGESASQLRQIVGLRARIDGRVVGMDRVVGQDAHIATVRSERDRVVLRDAAECREWPRSRCGAAVHGCPQVPAEMQMPRRRALRRNVGARQIRTRHRPAPRARRAELDASLSPLLYSVVRLIC